MRVDKFLQTSGLIKRRVLASEACRRGFVRVNGQLAKPSRELRAGDELVLDLPRREVVIKILQPLPERNFAKADRREFFEIVRDLPRTPSWDDDPETQQW